MRKVQEIACTPPPVLRQETLKLLRDVRQKRRELVLLETSLAREILEALQMGATVESGPFAASVRSHDAPAGRLLRVVVR